MKNHIEAWPLEPLAPLINHQDSYFAWWLPRCMWGKNQTTALFIYLSSDVGHMTDHHPWSETYPDWLRLIGHVGYLLKYNSPVSPASEVWRDRWVGGTTRPTLSCPRFFTLTLTLTAYSLPNLAGGSVAVSESNKSEWLDHVWKRMYPTTFGHVELSSGRSRGLEVLPRVRNLHLTYSSFQKASCLLFPSLKKRIINIQSRIAKIKKPKKSHRIPKSILNNMPYTSAFGWTSGWMIRGGTTLQSFNKSALDAWMDRYQHSNHGIWWNMNICTYAWKCICTLCNICKGFANIWVKGGFPY